MGIRSLNAKAVFLDRDGVINRALVRDGLPFPPPSLDELEILPHVPESLFLLNENGFLLIVVTNQPDVGRGIQKQETVEKMHKYLLEKLPLDDIYVCWHGQDGECDCRKPLPGMLFQAADKYKIDLKSSFMIGDRWRDVDAGQIAGCQTVLIEYGYQDNKPKIPPDVLVSSLSEAAFWILKNTKSKK